MLCSLNKVKNEFNFLLECPFIMMLETNTCMNTLIMLMVTGNLRTFNILLASTNDVTLNKLASYVHFAFKGCNQQLLEVGI